ncbi:hypothetical protein Clacol_004186 [Clathrus columnatus]|uniref:Uncharacterized protein n=1 Tax=Clathrus columnatus TaxID=1419009 RepID=A0AAV5A5P0_9AGAM|nr:hypothetical protein Clacol_004186 [Clathrus columnatus]
MSPGFGDKPQSRPLWLGREDELDLLSLIRNHSSHWHRLSLVASSNDATSEIFVYLTTSQHHDVLSRIDLCTSLISQEWEEFGIQFDLEDFAQEQDEESNARKNMSLIFHRLNEIYTPDFKELNLFTSALPFTTWSAPNQPPQLSSLRTLRIYEHNTSLPGIRAISLLYLLSHCPLLEYLTFKGSDDFDSNGLKTNIVHLEHLRQFNLAQTFHQRIILSHIHAPALQTLRLMWLNRPDVLIDESYEIDPSDSNDDLVEISQSPYTDLLTGAGLRSLIRRSTPPIRILDMDFSDMRSPKDFIWLFDQVPTLEYFRIVGSDMSDNVLFALAGQGPRRTGRRLCPRLTHIEFSRCDVITGRGILAIAKARGPKNNVKRRSKGISASSDEDLDVVLPRKRTACLKQFIVNACAGVDCESVAVMQHLMGAVTFDVDVIPPYVHLVLNDYSISFTYGRLFRHHLYFEEDRIIPRF